MKNESGLRLMSFLCIISTLTILLTLSGLQRAFAPDTKVETDYDTEIYDDHITIKINTDVDDSKEVKVDTDRDGDKVKTKIEIPIKGAGTTGTTDAGQNLENLRDETTEAINRLDDLPPDASSQTIENTVEEACPSCTEVPGIPGEPPPE